MEEENREQQANSHKSRPDANKHVVGLDEAGENFGVEDTPYNAADEIESQQRLRKRSVDTRKMETPVRNSK